MKDGRLQIVDNFLGLKDGKNISISGTLWGRPFYDPSEGGGEGEGEGGGEGGGGEGEAEGEEGEQTKKEKEKKNDASLYTPPNSRSPARVGGRVLVGGGRFAPPYTYMIKYMQEQQKQQHQQQHQQQL